MIEIENVYMIGDGSPLLVEESPDLKAILDDPNPVPPQRVTRGNKDLWDEEGPEGIRSYLAMAYLRHPSAQVRETAVRLVAEREVADLMVGNALAQRLVDYSSSVRLLGAEAIWLRGAYQVVETLRLLRSLDEAPGDDGGGQSWTRQDVSEGIRLLIDCPRGNHDVLLREFMRIWCFEDDRLGEFGLELLKIHSDCGNFQGKGKRRARKVGRQLCDIGGKEAMVLVFRAVRRLVGSEAANGLSWAWHEVGPWLA